MKWLIGLALLLGLSAPCFAASTPDPCVSSNSKTSVAISVNSATTTSLVAVVAGHGVFVCGFVLNIPGSATSAATAQLEYGTGASCSSPTTLTGAFGSNDAAVSTTPTTVQYGNGGATVAIAPPGNGVCLLTAGTTVLVTGILTYVQGSGSNFP